MANRLQRRKLNSNSRRKHLLKKNHTRVINRRKLFASTQMEEDEAILL